jgi:hypothetical protein
MKRKIDGMLFLVEHGQQHTETLQGRLKKSSNKTLHISKICSFATNSPL